MYSAEVVRISMKFLVFILLGLACRGWAGESCTASVRTPDRYVYIPVVVPAGTPMSDITSVSFAVKTCSDAHIALSTGTATSDLDKGVNVYEVVIGGWANTQSVIRKAKQGPNLAVKKSHRPLDCSQFMRFYVRWKNGEITVGAQTENVTEPGSFVDQPAFMTYRDPSPPPAINQMFVSGWRCIDGTWLVDFPCDEKPKPKPESYRVHMRTPDSYVYVPVAEPGQISLTDVDSISFAVKTCNDAHIALSTGTATSDLDKGVNVYEVVIGGWANTQSVIRKAKQGPNLAVKKSHRPLDCGQFRRFYVRWKNGEIAVGAQTENLTEPGFFVDQPAFMTYRDPSPHTISQVFVSGWFGQDGVWDIDLPTPKQQPPSTSVSCGAEIKTPAAYVYIPVAFPAGTHMSDITSVSFAVKICNDAHIALSTGTDTSDLDKGVNVYEVVIGGWVNTQSVIRKAKQGPNLAVKKSHRPLDCGQFRRFYVRWKNGEIAVGAQTENVTEPGSFVDQPAFMTYRDPSPPPAINRMFVSGWVCRSGIWRFDFPCVKPSPPSVDDYTETCTTYVHYRENRKNKNHHDKLFLPVIPPPTSPPILALPHLHFSVKGCREARLILSMTEDHVQLDNGVNLYEITIGDFSNKASVLTTKINGLVSSTRVDHSPLHCAHFRKFYVHWGDAGNTIQVGARKDDPEHPGCYVEEPPFLVQERKTNFPIAHVFTSGGTATWEFEFPCRTKSST